VRAGRVLLRAAREQLTGGGFAVALLWVLSGNERAARCYEADGWRPDGVRRREELGGTAVEELRYRRSHT
jgi:hypothetical protein